jgi:hypothetical protein
LELKWKRLDFLGEDKMLGEKEWGREGSGRFGGETVRIYIRRGMEEEKEEEEGMLGLCLECREEEDGDGGFEATLPSVQQKKRG